MAVVLSELQPRLAITEVRSDQIVIEGEFCLSDEEGVFDTYDIKVLLPNEFPFVAPTVYETGGRIPRIVDRHIIDAEGQCCVTVLDHWLARVDKADLSSYFEGPLAQFFLSQSWYELTEKWRYGEWSHGLGGLIEAYAAALGVWPDRRIVRSYLEVLASDFVDGSHRCPCGSYLSVAICHKERFEQLRQRISKPLARIMLIRLGYLDGFSGPSYSISHLALRSALIAGL